MRLTLSTTLIAAASFVAAPLLLHAAPVAEPTPAELEPQRVTLFKNGLGVVLGKASLPAEPGSVRISPLPQATLGSLWLGWSGKTQVSDIVARHAEVTEQTTAASIQEMLKANVGNEMTLMVGNEKLRGTLKAMPEREQDITQHLSRHGGQVFPPPIPLGDTLHFQTDDGLVILRAGSVQQVLLNDEAKTQFSQTTKQPVLDFTVTQTGDDAALWVEYMAQGITWSPSYRVDITDKDKARITAKAVIINDLMDLDGVAIELVTGYPHLQHSHRTSGFWLAPLQEFLNGLRNQGNQRGSAIMNQMMMQNAYAPNASPSMPPIAPPGGQTTDDLYFYPLTDVTLAKGERGLHQLFIESVPYQHCYTWDIEDYVDENNRYRYNRDDQEQSEVIWHAISLTNTTKLPWTTAPGQTIKDSRLMGQDTLHYTPVGGSTDLRITQALSIQPEQGEYEVERERNAERFHGSSYDRVTVRGELVLTNRKGEDVTVRITKRLSGQVVSADGEPEVNKLAKGLRRVNPQSELVWTLPVKADPENPTKISYTYTVFVRN